MNLQRKYYSREEFLEKIPEYINLFKIGFACEFNQEVIKHKYYDNPCGDFVMCVFEDVDANNKLVGIAAALPTTVCINGKQVKAAIAINGTTHPDYKGYSIFSEIMKGLSEELERRGYAFMYGFPHYTANRLFVTKYGGKDVMAIPTYAHIISDSADYLKYANQNIHTITFDETQWEPINNICIEKTPSYLKWRYKGDEYNLVGDDDGNFMIYKFYNDEINMVELYAKSREARKGFIGWILDFAQKNSYKKVTTFVNLNSETHEQLEQFGFFPTAPVRFFALKKIWDNLELDVYDSRNWYISMGDHNAY